MLQSGTYMKRVNKGLGYISKYTVEKEKSLVGLEANRMFIWRQSPGEVLRVSGGRDESGKG